MPLRRPPLVQRAPVTVSGQPTLMRVSHPYPMNPLLKEHLRRLGYPLVMLETAPVVRSGTAPLVRLRIAPMPMRKRALTVMLMTLLVAVWRPLMTLRMALELKVQSLLMPLMCPVRKVCAFVQLQWLKLSDASLSIVLLCDCL